MSTSVRPDRKGIDWEVGARLEAQDVTLKWYRAKITAINDGESKVMIHFDGWNTRWDDWFPMDSDRLRPCSKIADWRDKKRDQKSPFKVNQRVLARWKGLSMYPAKITAINGNGSFKVMFHDGIEQNVTASNIKHATADELNKIEKEIESRQWIHPAVAEGRRARKPVKTDEAFIVLDPVVRRRSTEKAEKTQQKVETRSEGKPKKVETANPAALLRRLKKDRKYLKLGEALPDTSGQQSSPTKRTADTNGTEAPEETYTSFKASASSKRRRTDSQISSDRATPVEAKNQPVDTDDDKAIAAYDDELDEPSEGPMSPRKEKTALLSKMARVREVCSRWKKEKEKKCKNKGPPDRSVSEDSASELPVTLDVTTTPVTTTAALSTSTPLSVTVDAGLTALDTSPIVSLTRLVVDASGRPSPSYSDKSDKTIIDSAPVTPAIPVDQDGKNKFPCPHCSRGFRKENLLNYHLKYYHSDETNVPLESLVPADELATARRKSDAGKRDDRKRSRDDEIEHRSSTHHKRRSEEQKSGNVLFDTKRLSTGSFTDELDSSVNVGELSSSGCLDASTPDLSGIKQERRDSMSVNVGEENHISDSDFSVKFERERYDSAGLDSVVSEDLESVVGEERREEVINCLCGVSDENGLMIQCEICLCWQHAYCMRLSEDKLPLKYNCWICLNPPGVRDSMRYIHDQEWIKEGQFTRFNYLARTRESTKRAPMLKAISELICDVHNVSNVLTGLKETAEVAAHDEHPELDSLYTSLQAAVAHGTVTMPQDQQSEENRSVDDGTTMTDGKDRVDGQGSRTNVNGDELNVNDSDHKQDSLVKSVGNKSEPLSAKDNDVQHDVDVESVDADSREVKMNGDVVSTDRAVHSGDVEVPSGGTIGKAAHQTDGTLTNGDLSAVTANGVSSGTVPQNGDPGTSVLSDHSYLQTGDRPRADAFLYSSDNEISDSEERRTKKLKKRPLLSQSQQALTSYISAQQDLIDIRLDLLAEQVSHLESLDAGHSLPPDYDALLDIVVVKKDLKGLIKDLDKVKRMATYSVGRR